MDKSYSDRQKRLGKFWFLIDIPLFIDGTSIGQLFDAMVRPEWQPLSRSLTEGTKDGASAKASGEISGKASIPFFLDKSIKLGLEAGSTTEGSRSHAVNEEVNRSAEMSLEKIVNRYVDEFPDRLLYATGDLKAIVDLEGKEYSWDSVDGLLTKPGIRPLIVLDLVEGAKVMPMFAETDDGEDVPMFEQLIEALCLKRTMKKYPDRKDSEFKKLSLDYWTTLANAFDSHIATKVVEGARSRLNWIDYRLMAGDGSDIVPIHLHLLPRGNYASGTFAYQFVRRAESHGIRIIGTLKRGQDVNVLGLYEC